ncbi:MAG: hypothetical protein ABIA12_00410 [Candidatus Aenigmatarchaeota archaeon]
MRFENGLLMLGVTVMLALVAVSVLASRADAYCDGNFCSTCSEGYVDQYRCSGSVQQRMWRYSDCTTGWRDYGSCSGGCSGYSCSRPSASVSMSTPSDSKEGDTVYETMRVENNGQYGATYDISAYVCRTDDGTDHGCSGYYGYGGSGCVRMSCDEDRFYVGGNGYTTVRCSLPVGMAGHYKVKVVLSEDAIINSQTLYSSEFKVTNSHGIACPEDRRMWGGDYDWGYDWNYPCFGIGCARADEKSTADYRVGDYRCFGSYRQQLVQDGCEKRWRITDYCPYGCEGNKCVEPAASAKVGEPEVFLRTTYEAERCEVTDAQFSIKNSGEAGSFELKVSGEVAVWVDVVPSVTIGKGETKQVTAFVSVPCDAASGEHAFTITASGKTTDSRTATVDVRSAGMFNTQLSDLFGMALAAVVIAAAVMKRDALLAYARRGGSKKHADERFG